MRATRHPDLAGLVMKKIGWMLVQLASFGKESRLRGARSWLPAAARQGRED